MTDTVKRGPGRPPKATATEPVFEDVRPGDDHVAPGDRVYSEGDTNMPDDTAWPVLDRKLVQTGHGPLLWVPPTWNESFFTTFAYGWSDGIVTWGPTRG